MNVTVIIACIVGVVSCLIGVATFVSAQLTKARQDGVMIAKMDQCVKGIDDIKADARSKNKQFDNQLDNHARDIVELQTQVKSIFKTLEQRKG